LKEIRNYSFEHFYYRAIGSVEVEFTRNGLRQTIKGQAVSEVIFTK